MATRDPAPYNIREPKGGWRKEGSFTETERLKLRPIAETLAMLDGNAFFTMGDGEHWWADQYLPEAHALYEGNGGDNGWASEASFAKPFCFPPHTRFQGEVMSEEIDIVSRVGGAILLAETQWTPKAGVSKERVMGQAALEAMADHPTLAALRAIQDTCARYIHPESKMTKDEFIDEVLKVADDRDLVRAMRKADAP